MLLSSSCCGSPKAVAGSILRVSFGLALLFVGLAHYMQFDSYTLMVSDGLGPLEMLGTILSYVLPGLMIVGGALLAIGVMKEIGVWFAGLGLALIPPGMILKTVLSGVDLSDMMPGAINAFIWLLVYYLVARSMSCCGSCAAPAAAPKAGAPAPTPKPMMAAPAKPLMSAPLAPKPPVAAAPAKAMTPAPAAKKAPAKKAAPKKKADA